MPPPSATYRECAYGYPPFFPPATTHILSVSRVIICVPRHQLPVDLQWGTLFP